MRNKIFIWMFFTILCLPVFQGISNVFPQPELSGVEWISRNKHPSYKNIIDGDFQDNFSKVFNQRIGFRSYFIKSYNQFYYSFFNRSPNTNVVIGENGQLYMTDYISQYYSKPNNKKLPQLTDNIKKLKAVQDMFYEKGIILIIVISPNKAAVYPENIPEKLKSPEINPGSNYRAVVELLDNYKINYIDGHKIFMDHKNKSPYVTFPSSGIHWNNFGASLVINELLHKFEKLSNKKVDKLSYTHISLDKNPVGKENDLASLLNIWTNPAKGTFPHPAFQRSGQKNKFTPDTLIVGSSFTEQIAELFNDSNIARNLSRFYYYSSYIKYSPSQDTKIGKLDWHKDVFNRDLIVLEINEGYDPDNYGFVSDAFTMMRLQHINNMDFAYKNNEYVEPLLLKGKLTYRIKKGISSPVILLRSDKIKINDKLGYTTASFIAKDFNHVKCNLFPGKLLSAENSDSSGGYKLYKYVFDTSNREINDYTLQFSFDGNSAIDNNAYIQDIKLYSTKH